MDILNMIKVEFHCHSMYSIDSLQKPQSLIESARKKGLDKVIVTDHNTIQGALEAQKLAPDMIIIGEEIQTSEGEILAAFVTEEIPSGLEPAEVIQRLKKQNAFISVSHPFDRTRVDWKMETLLKHVREFDAIETFNARCMFEKQNLLAQQFAETHHLPGTAGSDSHFEAEMGRAIMLLPLFNSANELRAVLPQATFQASRSPYWVHFASRYARIFKIIFKNWNNHNLRTNHE